MVEGAIDAVVADVLADDKIDEETAGGLPAGLAADHLHELVP